jgi:hypothetical protein
MRTFRPSIALSLTISTLALAQATQPTTRPAERVLPADQMLNQMLRPSGAAPARPLQPMSQAPAIDTSTGSAAVAPGAASLHVLREGTFIVDRTGRLSRGADGQSWELTFEADGRAMKDPPLVVLPNLKLMAMEDAIKSQSRDLRFRVTGMVTEYGGRNYILLEKVVVVPDAAQQGM